MATKKQIDVARREAGSELFGVILAMEYAIVDMENFRDYFRESATDLTKEITKKKRKFKKIVENFEKVRGTKYRGIRK